MYDSAPGQQALKEKKNITLWKKTAQHPGERLVATSVRAITRNLRRWRDGNGGYLLLFPLMQRDGSRFDGPGHDAFNCPLQRVAAPAGPSPRCMTLPRRLI